MNSVHIIAAYFIMIVSYLRNSQHFMEPKEAILWRIQVFWDVWYLVADLVFPSVFKNVVPSSSKVERSKEDSKCRRQVEMYRSVSPLVEGSKTSMSHWLLCLQEPTTGPCPKPDESSPHPFHPIPLRFILIFSFSVHLNLPNDCLTSGCIPSIMYTFLLKG